MPTLLLMSLLLTFAMMTTLTETAQLPDLSGGPRSLCLADFVRQDGWSAADVVGDTGEQWAVFEPVRHVLFSGSHSIIICASRLSHRIYETEMSRL